MSELTNTFIALMPMAPIFTAVIDRVREHKSHPGTIVYDYDGKLHCFLVLHEGEYYDVPDTNEDYDPVEELTKLYQSGYFKRYGSIREFFMVMEAREEHFQS